MENYCAFCKNHTCSCFRTVNRVVKQEVFTPGGVNLCLSLSGIIYLFSLSHAGPDITPNRQNFILINLLLFQESFLKSKMPTS